MIKKILSIVCIAGSVFMFSCAEGSRENQFEDGSEPFTEDQPTQRAPTVHPDNTTGSATYGDGGSNATGTTAGINAGSTTVGNTTSGNAGTTVGSEYDGNTTGMNHSEGSGTGTMSGTTAGAGTTSGANSGGTTGSMKNKNNRGTADTVTRNQQRVVPQTGTGNKSGSSLPNERETNQENKEY